MTQAQESQDLQTAGQWVGVDPRYRGYRPTARGVRLDHRVRQARALLAGRRTTRVLDLGAGDGFVTAELAGCRAKLAVAVDVNRPPPLTARRRQVQEVNSVLPGPLPFRPATFDVVISLETIEHLLDPDALLTEVTRVLVPDGCFILSTPRLDSFLVVASLLAGVQPPGIEASPRRRYGNPFGEQRPSGHVHLFTKRALVEALAVHGLQVDGYREARFSSSWWQAVRSDRRPRLQDLAIAAAFAVYDLVPFRKDVMIVRAVRKDKA